MAKEEFSVNELEPVRNNDEIVTEHVETTDVHSNINFEQDKEVIEYEGPTIKEVLVNSVNPDYQGPTAKEIVVNSVKVDNTKRKNMVGLIVLIVVLSVIGFIVFLDMSSEDKKAKEPNYFNDLPKWSNTYKEYFQEYSKDRSSYDVSFIDLDFDDEAEVIIKYTENNNVTYEIVDLLEDDDFSFKYDNVTDIIMMYSFTDNNVSWFMNSSLEDSSLYLVDIGKRLNNDTNYELHLDYDSLMEFKSNHFNISYSIGYTNVNFRTYEKNIAEAIKLYEQEKEEIDNLANGVVEKYSDVI